MDARFLFENTYEHIKEFTFESVIVDLSAEHLAGLQELFSIKMKSEGKGSISLYCVRLLTA